MSGRAHSLSCSLTSTTPSRTWATPARDAVQRPDSAQAEPGRRIVAGGPNTVTDGVLAQISAATGLAIKDIADTPSDGIVRVAGSGRDQTAVALSELIAAYNPKFLPTDATAADSDLLDGKDSTEFLGTTEKAADSSHTDEADNADTLDGLDSRRSSNHGGHLWTMQVR